MWADYLTIICKDAISGNAEVDDEVLKKAVEAQDYPVTGIQ